MGETKIKKVKVEDEKQEIIYFYITLQPSNFFKVKWDQWLDIIEHGELELSGNNVFMINWVCPASGMSYS